MSACISRRFLAENQAFSELCGQGLPTNSAEEAIFDLPDLSTFAPAHNYPMWWYTNTITSPPWSFMGFGNSFEAPASLPPTGSQYAPGLCWVQADSPGNEYSLQPTDSLAIRDDLTLALGGVAGYVATVVQDATKTIDVLGDAAVQVRETTTELVNNARQDVWEMLNSAGLWLRLHTTPASGPAAGSVLKKDGGLDPGLPAAVSMEVIVPANASFLEFDFTVSGDGQDDAVVCGVNGTNVFSLQTRFVAVNTTVSSGLIDVSLFEGGPLALFFGVVGGTSTNCTVGVNNIRFIALGPPALTVVQPGNQCVVSWPASAQGFVLESAF